MQDSFVLGDWNACCWECGRNMKASRLRKNWQGQYVCPEHWDDRHPQDFVGKIPTPAPSQPDFIQGDPGITWVNGAEPDEP